MLSAWVKIFQAQNEVALDFAGYKLAKEKLGFVVKWLEDNKDENGQWDLGAEVKDNLYFRSQTLGEVLSAERLIVQQK